MQRAGSPAFTTGCPSSCLELLDEWLDPHTEGSEELLVEIAAGGAEVAEYALFHEVDGGVGNVRSSGPSLIEPIRTT
jgi:hypothetical protein